MTAMVFVDSNVLVYTLDSREADKQAQAAAFDVRGVQHEHADQHVEREPFPHLGEEQRGEAFGVFVEHDFLGNAERSAAGHLTPCMSLLMRGDSRNSSTAPPISNQKL